MDQSKTQQMIEALARGEQAALRRGLVALARQFQQASQDLRNRPAGGCQGASAAAL